MKTEINPSSPWHEEEDHHTSTNSCCQLSVKKRKRCDEQEERETSCVTTKTESNNIRVIAPTIQGLTEAAQIIRRGKEVVSIPTEKNYCFTSFVPFQIPIRRPPQVDSPRQPLWYTRCSNSFGVHVLLHHPVQAYNFVSFTTPKTFVLRQRALSDESRDENDTLMAVKFSESHEVLCRLSSSFWPGATTIYAPVRTRRLKSTLVSSDITMRASSESLSSLSSDDSHCYNDSASTQLFPSIPVMPDSVLLSSKQLCIPIEENEDDILFVGMRCPSHPIARRVLSKAYGQKEENKPSRLKGAIIGVETFDSVHSLGDKPESVSCNEVRRNLHASDVYGMRRDEHTLKDSDVHVVNGEDSCEIFYVPPCHFSSQTSVSLVIDAPRRTIILLRDRSEISRKASVVSSDPRFEVQVEDVIRVLCPTKPHDMGSVKSTTIAAVMSKWTVVEKEI